MLRVLNLFIRNTLFSYFLIVITCVCFLVLALCSPRRYHFISRLIGFRTVVHWVLVLCWGDGHTYELDRHRPVTASMVCSQGSQHKNIKSPNTNSEPAKMLTNSKQDKNMGPLRYILTIRMWPECSYKIPHICIEKSTQKSMFFSWYCHQKMVWAFHAFVMQFSQFWRAT